MAHQLQSAEINSSTYISYSLGTSCQLWKCHHTEMQSRARIPFLKIENTLLSGSSITLVYNTCVIYNPVLIPPSGKRPAHTRAAVRVIHRGHLSVYVPHRNVLLGHARHNSQDVNNKTGYFYVIILIIQISGSIWSISRQNAINVIFSISSKLGRNVCLNVCWEHFFVHWWWKNSRWPQLVTKNLITIWQ